VMWLWEHPYAYFLLKLKSNGFIGRVGSGVEMTVGRTQMTPIGM
jgi:hypothetical protein